MKRMIFILMSISFFGTFHLKAFQMNPTETNPAAHSTYPIAPPSKQGYLAVSDKHSLYYALYGNPEGIPVVVLHGGPGAGCDQSMTRFFDLDKWYVIMFDQRGAGRSTPRVCMEENTPQHSVADIEVLRNYLGIDQWAIFGGSWGSGLALLYGQNYPDKCLGFILRGIFLARPQDYTHLFYDMGKIFPEAYDPFFHYIPKEERHDLISAYYQRVMDPDPEVHMAAARAFMKYDVICSTHLPNQESVEKIVSNNALTLSIARACLYYSFHHFFLEPNQILSNMQRIAHIPSIIIHGRWDASCLPEAAYHLHKNWKNSTLWMIPDGGHSASDPAITQALTKATDLFIAELILNNSANLR